MGGFKNQREIHVFSWTKASNTYPSSDLSLVGASFGFAFSAMLKCNLGNSKTQKIQSEGSRVKLFGLIILHRQHKRSAQPLQGNVTEDRKCKACTGR